MMNVGDTVLVTSVRSGWPIKYIKNHQHNEKIAVTMILSPTWCCQHHCHGTTLCISINFLFLCTKEKVPNSKMFEYKNNFYWNSFQEEIDRAPCLVGQEKLIRSSWSWISYRRRTFRILEISFGEFWRLEPFFMSKQFKNTSYENKNGCVRVVNRVSAKRTLRFKQIRFLVILNDFDVSHKRQKDHFDLKNLEFSETHRKFMKKLGFWAVLCFSFLHTRYYTVETAWIWKRGLNLIEVFL